jgi:hypothetical protein
MATVKRLQDQVNRLTQERDAETKRADGLQKALQQQRDLRAVEAKRADGFKEAFQKERKSARQFEDNLMDFKLAAEKARLDSDVWDDREEVYMDALDTAEEDLQIWAESKTDALAAVARSFRQMMLSTGGIDFADTDAFVAYRLREAERTQRRENDAYVLQERETAFRLARSEMLDTWQRCRDDHEVEVKSLGRKRRHEDISDK